MRQKKCARGSLGLRVKLHLGKISADVSVVTVCPISEGMKPGEEFVNHEGSKEHVDADDSWPLLLHSSKISFINLATIELGVCSSHLLGFDSGHDVDATAK